LDVSAAASAAVSHFQGHTMAMHGYVKQHGWQRPAIIGLLGATKESAWNDFLPAFERRLRQLGWVDGDNLHIEYRWADGRADRYGKIAKSFVDHGVDIIVTAGTPAVAAAKKATKAIPIVFAAAGDPVRTKLVHSLARPGGNVTGLSHGQTELAGKRLDLLRQVVRGLHELAILGNFASGNARLEMEAVQKAARKLKIATITRDIRREAQIVPAIKSLKGKADALYVCTDPFVTNHRVDINTLAAAAGLPTMHAFRHHAEDGGLMSYGPDFRDLFHSAADIVDRILRGAKPADIPVKLVTKCERVFNRNTARALKL
jgi:putative tryptophan/tyrosine transport system substrate-binding protein